MPRSHPSYSLTAEIIAAHAGEQILCLAPSGIGRRFRLHAERPGAALNSRVERPRADLPGGAAHVVAPVEDAHPLILVRIQGAIEQRAGYYDECGGWSDGHDAICERLCDAFEQGDVLLLVDSPGGAAAGIDQNVTRALAAKTAHGRRVTVYADEMIGSAATWWAMALGDEVYGPPAGQFGSIGARGAHTSIAGALDKEGVVVTYFADPPEKVALAPERALDATGAARGMRDVTLAADAFRAACCASPLGMRGGLTPEYLKELGADMLTGIAAVEAGLADGIDTLENVIAYALALAESDVVAAPTTGAMGATNKGDRAMRLRAEEGGKPEKEPDGGPESERGEEPTGKCGACGMQNEDDAKFCDQCGKSMAAERHEEEERAEDEPTPSSKPMHPPAPERMTAPAKMSADASLAAILGASSESPLALRTAAIGLRHVRDTAAGVTGKATHDEIVGSLLAVPEKIARGKRAADDLAADRRKAEGDERWTLAHRLVATGAIARTKR